MIHYQSDNQHHLSSIKKKCFLHVSTFPRASSLQKTIRTLKGAKSLVGFRQFTARKGRKSFSSTCWCVSHQVNGSTLSSAGRQQQFGLCSDLQALTCILTAGPDAGLRSDSVLTPTQRAGSGIILCFCSFWRCFQLLLHHLCQ